jgi:hypothetical protein
MAVDEVRVCICDIDDASWRSVDNNGRDRDSAMEMTTQAGKTMLIDDREVVANGGEVRW